MNRGSTLTCAVAAGGILAAAVGAYLLRAEPRADRQFSPTEDVQTRALTTSRARPEGPRLWPHPWLGINRAVRSILRTRWDANTWPTTKTEMRKALEVRRQIRRAGWFN
jgi:hypothetical protein